jgi:hypothetical protein
MLADYLPSWLIPARSRNTNRAIFRFWDGQQDRAADPFEVLRAIENDPEFSLERDGALLIIGDDDSIQKTVRCVRRAFQVKEFSQGGLLEAECLELIERFYEFLSSLKKNISASPISLQPTATESSTASTDPAPIPGNSSSDLPKTATEAS